MCQCDVTGSCPCKDTVIGKKCASCSRGHFGLSATSEEGCTQCFCFGRSRDCGQVDLDIDGYRMGGCHNSFTFSS